MCVFVALVSDAPISLPHIFICSLIKVHRSSSTTYAFFFPVFIDWILLHLSLDEFPTSEPVHIIAHIGDTFLRQRVAQMKASYKRPRVKTSGVTPRPPSSTGNTMVEESVDPATATVVPPPSTSDDSDIQRMLETVMIVQAAHGQLLVDMLDEFRALREDLEHLRPLPPHE